MGHSLGALAQSETAREKMWAKMKRIQAEAKGGKRREQGERRGDSKVSKVCNRGLISWIEKQSIVPAKDKYGFFLTQMHKKARIS